MYLTKDRIKMCEELISGSVAYLAASISICLSLSFVHPSASVPSPNFPSLFCGGFGFCCLPTSFLQALLSSSLGQLAKGLLYLIFTCTSSGLTEKINIENAAPTQSILQNVVLREVVLGNSKNKLCSV